MNKQTKSEINRQTVTADVKNEIMPGFIKNIASLVLVMGVVLPILLFLVSQFEPLLFRKSEFDPGIMPLLINIALITVMVVALILILGKDMLYRIRVLLGKFHIEEDVLVNIEETEVRQGRYGVATVHVLNFENHKSFLVFESSGRIYTYSEAGDRFWLVVLDADPKKVINVYNQRIYDYKN